MKGRHSWAGPAGALLLTAVLLSPSPGRAAARSVDVTLVNHTGSSLSLPGMVAEHQGISSNSLWRPGPAGSVAAGQTVRWHSESDGFLAGTEAWVRYRIDATGGLVYLHWNNPYNP